MAKFQAGVPTEHASRYLQQLCKHWSHRFPVEFDPAHGVVHMNGADCTFDAEPNRLSLVLEGKDQDTLSRLCNVVSEHLKRFAHREEIDVRWVAMPG
jgi:uncharacterized protein